ncbi:MAG TPA: OB-fold domain-containing protein [Acidimicrobiales bacterium]|nr:OB-fold domain-containing protein [Acidimicrobiales bacterium]
MADSTGRPAPVGPGTDSRAQSVPAGADRTARVGAVRRDDATAAFFDGAAARTFLLRRCPTGHWSEPAAEVCGDCGRTDLEWAAASGTASLVSWSVVPGADSGPSTVLAIGELTEGPWWWSQLTVADPDQLAVGRPLRIVFARAATEDETEAVPLFALEAGGRAPQPGG